jgi:hypothetical protein
LAVPAVLVVCKGLGIGCADKLVVVVVVIVIVIVERPCIVVVIVGNVIAVVSVSVLASASVVTV